MNSADFTELRDQLTTKVTDLQKVVDIKLAIRDDQECLEHLQCLESELDDIEIVMAELKEGMQNRRNLVAELQEKNKAVAKLITHLRYTLSNIPERLPKHQDSESSAGASGGGGDTCLSTNQKPSKQTAPPTVTNQPVSIKQQNIYYPEIEYLKVEEFSEVPKYLKGRINYDQVNKFIEGMNTAFLSKYKLLRQKKSSLNDANRKRCETYKQQETKETAGCYFVTDQDLKDFGGLKIDSVGRSIQTILRHCKRVREVRGGKITRIVYIDSY